MTWTAEVAYRGSVFLILCGFALVRGHFQSRSKQANVASGREQSRDRNYYRLVGTAYVLTCVYALSPWFDFAQVNLSAWSRCMGGTLAFAGLAGVWWTHASLGRNWSGILELRQDHHLVTHGPYRHVRHPMYSAFTLLAIGIGVLSANWFVAAVQIGAFVATYLARVDDEEAMMLEAFGDEYREYMQRTGRLLPRF